MRTARGSRTCAQIGSAGRGGASTALIASGSAARQKTRAQTHPRTRRGRCRVLRGARRHSTQDSAPRELRGGRRALHAHARPLYGRRVQPAGLVGSAASLCSHATLLGRHGRRRTTAACTTPRRRALARSADGCGVYGRSRTPRRPRRNSVAVVRFRPGLVCVRQNLRGSFRRMPNEPTAPRSSLVRARRRC